MKIISQLKMFNFFKLKKKYYYLIIYIKIYFNLLIKQKSIKKKTLLKHKKTLPNLKTINKSKYLHVNVLNLIVWECIVLVSKMEECVQNHASVWIVLIFQNFLKKDNLLLIKLSKFSNQLLIKKSLRLKVLRS